jgi:hypothetical protein
LKKIDSKGGSVVLHFLTAEILPGACRKMKYSVQDQGMGEN